MFFSLTLYLCGKRCISVYSGDCSDCIVHSMDIYEEDQYINKCQNETLKALMINNISQNMYRKIRFVSDKGVKKWLF